MNEQEFQRTMEKLGFDFHKSANPREPTLLIKEIRPGINEKIALLKIGMAGCRVHIAFESQSLTAYALSLGLNFFVDLFSNESGKLQIARFDLKAATLGVGIFSSKPTEYHENEFQKVINDLEEFNSRMKETISHNVGLAQLLEYGDLSPGIVFSESRHIIAALLYEMEGLPEAALRVLNMGALAFAAEPQDPEWMHARKGRFEQSASLLKQKINFS